MVNIIDQNIDYPPDEVKFMEKQEKALYDKFKEIRPDTEKLIEDYDFTRVLESIFELKKPIDDFFDCVLVNTDDMELQTNRKALLSEIGRFFLKIADFKEI